MTTHAARPAAIPPALRVVLRRALSPRLLALAVLVLAALGDSGCNHPAQSQLEQNKSLWAGQRPVKYQYTFSWSCFCAPDFTDPVKITVENDKITSVVSVATGMAVAKPTDYRTIDGLFAFIQDAIDRNADQISASYDPVRGFPTSVSVDYLKNAFDEERGFTAKDLVVQ